MSIKVEEHYHAAVIAISGKFLGSIAGPAFREKVDKLKADGKRKLVIDLSKTELMDSSGIGELIRSLTTMRSVDGDVKLAGMEARVRNLFLITRLLGSVFEDYPTKEEALASFKEGAEA